MKTAFKWCAIWFSLAALPWLVGCGGGSEADSDADQTATETAESTEGNPLTAPVDYLGAVNQAQKTAGKKLSLVGIQQAIQQFQVMEERFPRNLQEVVSSGYIARLPEVPRGQKLVYNPQTGVVTTGPAQP